MGKKRKEIKCDTGGLMGMLERADKEATVHKVSPRITKKDWEDLKKMLMEYKPPEFKLYFHSEEAAKAFYDEVRDELRRQVRDMK